MLCVSFSLSVTNTASDIFARIEFGASWVRHQGHCYSSCAFIGHEIQGEGQLEWEVSGELAWNFSLISTRQLDMILIWFSLSLSRHKTFQFLFQISKATESYQQLLEQGLPQLAKFLRKRGGFERELQVLERIRPRTRRIIEKLLHPTEPMGLITHTDFWSNNLLFKEQIDNNYSDSCSLIDWQMITYSSPTNDIALLITSSLSAATRRQHTTKLLDFYYNLLKSNCLKLSIDIELDLQYSRNKMDCDFRWVLRFNYKFATSSLSCESRSLSLSTENRNCCHSCSALDQLTSRLASTRPNNGSWRCCTTSTRISCSWSTTKSLIELHFKVTHYLWSRRF